jgi:hypothetical protein
MRLDFEKQPCLFLAWMLLLKNLATSSKELIERWHGLTASQSKCRLFSQRVERCVTDDEALHFGVVKDDSDIVACELHVKLSAFEAEGDGPLHGRHTVFGRAFKLMESPMGDDAWLFCLDGIEGLLG